MKTASFFKIIGAMSFTLLAAQAHADNMMGLNLEIIDGEVLSNCSATSPAPVFCKSTEGVEVSEKFSKKISDRIADYEQKLKEYQTLQSQISELEKPQSSTTRMMNVRDISAKKNELAKLSLGLSYHPYTNAIPIYSFKLFQKYTNGLQKAVVIKNLGSEEMQEASPPPRAIDHIFFYVHHNASMGMNLLIIRAGEEKTLASCKRTEGPVKIFGLEVPGSSTPQILCTLANNRGFLRFAVSQ